MAVRTGRSKGDKLGVTDHSAIDYPDFRRDFYVEAPELSKMGKEEVEDLRKELDDIKVRVCLVQTWPRVYLSRVRVTFAHVPQVRGKDVPKPIKTWHQAGLPSLVISQLQRTGCESPLPIQVRRMVDHMVDHMVDRRHKRCQSSCLVATALALPRLGVARHWRFCCPCCGTSRTRRRCSEGTGRWGSSWRPPGSLCSRLARRYVGAVNMQSSAGTCALGFDGSTLHQAKRFCRMVGLTAVSVYGGSGVGEQIRELKRGAEVVVCTPGRFIDVLVTGCVVLTAWLTACHDTIAHGISSCPSTVAASRTQGQGDQPAAGDLPGPRRGRPHV